MQIDHNPPVAGPNVFTVNVKDQTGKDVTDADVIIRYSMPAMPGMPPMNHQANTTLKDKNYKAEIDLHMAGPWSIEIKVNRGDKVETARFNIDAR